MREVAQEGRAVRRVRHLRMEQQTVEPPRIIGDCGERRALANPDGTEARRNAGDAVAMAHPDLLAPALVPDTLEQHAVTREIHEGASEFAMLGPRNLATQLIAHGLHAVADAEYRNARLEHRLWGARRSALGETGRTTRQDDPTRLPFGDAVWIDVERPDLAIDPGLTQPPSYQLGDLAAEVEDQHAFSSEGRRGGGIWHAIGHLASDRALSAGLDHGGTGGARALAKQAPAIAHRDAGDLIVVTLAQVGSQSRTSAGRGAGIAVQFTWVPAFAGMTT